MKRALLWLAAVLLGATLRAEAASPFLDPTFGSGGIAAFGPVSGTQTPLPLELASGKIAIVFGATWFEGTPTVGLIYYLARLNKSGSIDTTFAGNGMLELGRFRFSATSPSYFPTNVSEDAAGRLLVSGQQTDSSGASGVQQLVLKRYLANGTPDSTFATNGTGVWSMLTVPLVGLSVVDMRDLGGRKLLVFAGGFTGNSGEALTPRSVFVVVTENGNLDASFAGKGWQQVDYVASGVRVASDGTFSASGITSRIIDPQMTFITAKYDASGNAVGTRTSVSVPWRAVAFQRDGSYVTFPDTTTMEARDFAGNLDTLFGNAGLTHDAVDLNYHNVSRTPDGGVTTTLFTFDTAAATYMAEVCVWRANGQNESCDTVLDRVDGGPGFALLAPSGALYVTGPISTSARIARLNVTAPNIEYLNSTLGHYLVTYDGEEARIIDQGGAGPGWSRTGKNGFKSGGTTPVCRFYGTPGIGSNSHFFTISAQECELVKQDPGWTFEGYGFYATPAVNGQCEAPLIPVHRLYNNQAAQRNSNHRHVTDLSLVPAMTAQGWALEGVAFCARP